MPQRWWGSPLARSAKRSARIRSGGAGGQHAEINNFIGSATYRGPAASGLAAILGREKRVAVTTLRRLKGNWTNLPLGALGKWGMASTEDEITEEMLDVAEDFIKATLADLAAGRSTPRGFARALYHCMHSVRPVTGGSTPT